MMEQNHQRKQCNKIIGKNDETKLWVNKESDKAAGHQNNKI